MAISGKLISNKIEISSIVEQLENEIEENISGFDEKYSHKEDLEKLLQLAENLREVCNFFERLIQKNKRYRLLYLIFFVTTLSIIFSLTFYLPSNYLEENLGFWRYFVSIGVGGILGTFLGLIATTTLEIKSTNKKIKPEKLSLIEVLQILRETSDIIAKRENWSALKRAEFRIRLSRFNLQEEFGSAFDFFS